MSVLTHAACFTSNPSTPQRRRVTLKNARTCTSRQTKLVLLLFPTPILAVCYERVVIGNYYKQRRLGKIDGIAYYFILGSSHIKLIEARDLLRESMAVTGQW